MERFILDSRKAFKLDRYQEANAFNQKALERDTAALVIEGSGKIHGFFFAVQDDCVINPSLSKTKDVSNFYAADSPQTIKETDVGLKIKKALIEEDLGTVIAWVSPPGGEFDYKICRFEIGIVRKIMGIKILQTYGISLQNVTGEYCESLFLRLEEFSAKENQNINSPEDLRDKISILHNPSNLNWIDFISKIAPELNDQFTKIKNGEVHHTKIQAIKDAKEEVRKALKNENLSKENFVYIGANIEKGMEKRGWNINGGICGYLNNDLLKMKNKVMFGTVGIQTEGKQILPCVECPFCHKTVDAEIYDGQIHCPECNKSVSFNKAAA